MGKTSKTAPKRVKATINRTEAMRLRVKGLTYDEIGEKLAVSTGRARQYVVEEMQALQEEAGELALVLRKRRLEELQALMKQPYALALAGDIKAAELLLKLMDREAKLLGMDAPSKKTVETVTSNDPFQGMSEDELQAEARRRGLKVLDSEDQGAVLLPFPSTSQVSTMGVQDD